MFASCRPNGLMPTIPTMMLMNIWRLEWLFLVTWWWQLRRLDAKEKFIMDGWLDGWMDVCMPDWTTTHTHTMLWSQVRNQGPNAKCIGPKDRGVNGVVLVHSMCVWMDGRVWLLWCFCCCSSTYQKGTKWKLCLGRYKLIGQIKKSKCK